MSNINVAKSIVGSSSSWSNIHMVLLCSVFCEIKYTIDYQCSQDGRDTGCVIVCFFCLFPIGHHKKKIYKIKKLQEQKQQQYEALLYK